MQCSIRMGDRDWPMQSGPGGVPPVYYSEEMSGVALRSKRDTRGCVNE